MKKIVLLRHGQSEWNLTNRFTGWTDVDLSEGGLNEARQAAEILKANGYQFDIAYSSYLKRAIRTTWIVLYHLDLAWIPVEKTWMLNERHYGALEGLNKTETEEQYGKEQVRTWRRSADVRPPALEAGDPRNARFESKYDALSDEEIPLTESLIDTEERVLKYWNHYIKDALLHNHHILIAAHGNTIRALIKYLDHRSSDGIVGISVPTGIPLVYELDDDLNAITSYLLDRNGGKRPIQSQ
ncbi:phosphoglycerate mutase [Paenibacillus cellulosilyticus]|uniref:2,3-bisphosphoglycerate-dependent phosphoglycerate mutase n=1 Tax=Paenibacillus cellulosilyticus TaxID=375489 RepID=A0A2V2YR17_9BACL|nr:2,3-diphosphoglycerate-dependent phosphoglycerate mutase [Paenibacillus cellulosilyticus]PWV99498.1 phosphoglycerate mutase [Paenibacillus cellulosilyticus]QKS44752.1 2,3-diphosphoglycerate-dependent phosphoglycerate mutase [Paenibacillus cellulosilyticus]